MHAKPVIMETVLLQELELYVLVLMDHMMPQPVFVLLAV